mgnify:CR=1 FL=1
MKTIYLYSLFLLVGKMSLSQISFNVIKKDVQCNQVEYGEAEVVVTLTNPPYSYLWNTGQTSNVISGLNEGTYSVNITDSIGNDTVLTIDIKLVICLMAPEIVFTPNSDGINDTWFIQNSQYFPQTRIMIFNRLGQRIFEQNGLYEPWDGKDLLGVTVPNASYYYVIYQNHSDEGTIIKGCVSILK